MWCSCECGVLEEYQNHQKHARDTHVKEWRVWREVEQASVRMPAKTEGMPKLLAAHVHALLVQTGMAKTAKKFEGEFGGEVRREEGRLDMRVRACGIRRAGLL